MPCWLATHLHPTQLRLLQQRLVCLSAPLPRRPLPPQANWLKAQGVSKGDCVAIYMPMVMQLPIAMLACARIGAIHSVVFGGFSADALAGAGAAWVLPLCMQATATQCPYTDHLLTKALCARAMLCTACNRPG